MLSEQMQLTVKAQRRPKDCIAAGWRFTIGLQSDGTVTAVGRNHEGQCNVSGWRDIGCGSPVP